MLTLSLQNTIPTFYHRQKEGIAMPATITPRGYIRVVHHGFDGTLTAWRNKKLSEHPDITKMLCGLFNSLILVGNFKVEDWFPKERSKVLVKNLVWTWLGHKRKRPATIETQGYVLRRYILPAIGPKSIKELTRHDFWWIRENHGDTAMALRIRRVAQAFLNWCWREGMMDRQLFLPTISVQKKPTPFIELKDRQSIYTRIDARFKDAFLLSLEMGMRVGEIVALKWDATDFERGRIRIIRSLSGQQVVDMPKGGDEVWLPMTGRIKAMLLRRRQERKSHWVFPGIRGNHIWPYDMRQAFKKAARECGMPQAKLHHCRHSFAQDMIDEGRSLEEVSALLGHSSILTTERAYKGRGIRSLGRIERIRKHEISN
jgi:integrase